jgi:hypothetical protein
LRMRQRQRHCPTAIGAGGGSNSTRTRGPAFSRSPSHYLVLSSGAQRRISRDVLRISVVRPGRSFVASSP